MTSAFSSTTMAPAVTNSADTPLATRSPGDSRSLEPPHAMRPSGAPAASNTWNTASPARRTAATQPASRSGWSVSRYAPETTRPSARAISQRVVPSV